MVEHGFPHLWNMKMNRARQRSSSRKWEVGSWKSEVGNRKWEVGSGKWEVRSWRWKVRSLTMQHWVSTVRNPEFERRKSEVGRPSSAFVHYCSQQWHTGVCEETFDVNSSSNNTKYLKFNCQKVESTRNGKLRRSSGRFQTLIWRPGETVQNLESPGLSGRVESPVLLLWRRTRKWKWGIVYNNTG